MGDTRDMADSTTLAPTPGTVPKDPGGVYDDLTFDSFQTAMKGAGYTEEPDPTLEGLGIDHEPTVLPPGVAPSEPAAATPADEAAVVDPLSDMGPLERLDHRDAIATLTGAGFSVEQLAGMDAATQVMIAKGFRERQTAATDAQAVSTALATPAAQQAAEDAFDMTALFGGVQEEMGEKAASDIRESMGKVMAEMRRMNAQSQADAAQEANGMRLVSEQELRLQSANPGLKDRPQVMDRISKTVGAFLQSGVHGTDPQHLYNLAARALELNTAASVSAEPKVGAKAILQAQPQPTKAIKAGNAAPPQNMQQYQYALLALRMSDLNMTHEAAIEQLGPAPAE